MGDDGELLPSPDDLVIVFHDVAERARAAEATLVAAGFEVVATARPPDDRVRHAAERTLSAQPSKVTLEVRAAEADAAMELLGTVPVARDDRG